VIGSWANQVRWRREEEEVEEEEEEEVEEEEEEEEVEEEEEEAGNQRRGDSRGLNSRQELAMADNEYQRGGGGVKMGLELCSLARYNLTTSMFYIWFMAQDDWIHHVPLFSSLTLQDSRR